MGTNKKPEGVDAELLKRLEELEAENEALHAAAKQAEAERAAREAAALEAEKAAQAQRAKEAVELVAAAEREAKKPIRVAEADDPNMELVDLLVPINLAEPGNTHVTVGLNGRMWQIQRGQQVRVPKAVQEILLHSMEQTMATVQLISQVAQPQ